LRLEKLWTCAELQSPGNVLAIEEDGQPTRLFVFEGGRTVTEVDAEGEIVRRHALEIPEQAIVTYARTTVDPDGQRVFAASSPLAPLVFVFDQDWQLVATVPAAGDAPLQIVDLALANVGEGEGEVEVVAASVGDQGLVALGQDGAVRWRNRAFPNVVSAATTPEDEFGQWAFLLTGESGEILRVNRFGHEEPAVKVANWPILRLRAGQFESPKQAVYLGLSNNAKGDVFAVGLSSELKECWNYPLPSGAHQRPIEPIASSDVLPGQSGQWWPAGPDGSVHLISEDGEFFDSFHVGAVLTGLAATRINNQPVLLLATDEGLSAWGIELPTKETPKKPSRREF
jgi:hypothetical protein